MKPSNVIIVLIIALTVNNVLSQETNKNSPVTKMYMKAGIELSNLLNVTVFKSGKSADFGGGVKSYTGSVGFEYSRKLSFEVQYKYMNEVSYRYDKELYMHNFEGDNYYKYGSGYMNSNYMNLRANYFVNEDRRDNPIYFIGAMDIGIQKVNHSESTEYPDRTETITNEYIRYIIGPEAGLGIYFDLGVISFQTEFTFGSRFSPFARDRHYTENSLTMNFSPIFNIN